MTALAALLACFAGFTALAFAMDKHHRDMTGTLPKGRPLWPFKAGGWGALALAMAPLSWRFGLSVGITFWIGLMMLGALGVALGLTYRPRLLPRAGLIALPLSLCAAALAGVS
ncbi:DUF3325 domain-containing protein (plasmid) [Sphingobium sp. V4]|uniref:DUF3325 domain-containing protein n=1 Tax=Sphingobium sp. V4 TaxID=3038927 RepID=UPI002557D7DA|nr:DUF3325 domain-containing protein [Sphingobium sp. V4]WIW90362.1 DUF3325 domain-containing protein [Sphingobium sp. V4]